MLIITDNTTVALTHSRSAECDSRQTIQARPDHPDRMVSPRGLPVEMHWWHQPQVDLFAMRFNNKLPQFMSPVRDPIAWAVDELSLPWEDLDPYHYALKAKWQRSCKATCARESLIAIRWPNMPWFCDHVESNSLCPTCPVTN